MQYQVFVQTHFQKGFVASVVGMSNLTTEGETEEEAISKVKSALEAELTTGKFVSIEVNIETQPNQSQMKYLGIFANDPSFDDFMDKLAFIRKESNLAIDT